jgi:HD-GYP domain-containing protein (c-di-GMP phosphodiesterase class II)
VNSATQGPGEGAWDVLERFGAALQRCDQTAQQVRLVLSSVQEALDADAVVWLPGGDEEGDSCGPVTLTPAWCRLFAERVLSAPQAAAGQMLYTSLDPAAKPATPWPYSAALVRVSRSRSSWVAALSFHPRRIFQNADLQVMSLARRMVLSHRQQQQVYERLKGSLLGLVRCLTAAIDAKDPYTWGHSERVARIAVRLGQQLGLAAAVQSDLYLAGLLHDIGKIGVRDVVLQKPGRLTDDEMRHIQEHAVTGDRLLAPLAALSHLRVGVRNHHERWDGRGYPDRLAGEAIPLQARVLAVADSCDAMMSARPYRPALPTHRIDAVMAEGAGSQWDPHIVAAFLVCKEELYSICQRGLGDSVFAAVERALNVGAELEQPSSARGGIS